jgi:hypothetical protein
MALLAKARDGHANLWSSLQARPPVGKCQIPVNVRFVENQPVIGSFPASEANSVGGLQLGDVITKLDDVPLAKLIAQCRLTTQPPTKRHACATSAAT